MALCLCLSVKAQEEEKVTLYNFAYSYPQSLINGTDPEYPKVLFVSPVVEYEFNEEEFSMEDYNNLNYVWEIWLVLKQILKDINLKNQ